MKKDKGNLIVTFIMVIALSMTVFVFISFTGIRLKESGIKVSELESFYTAEAGLHKAIWYLATPTTQGGKGLTWRATNFQENYGWGAYYLTVQNSAVSGEVLIISTGEVGGILKTTSQIVNIGGLPAAFDYALYSNLATSLSGNTNIEGDMYVNGNTSFSGNASVTDGYLYHPTGTTISGHGTYTDGGEPNPKPNFPVIDTSSYDSLITTAQSVPEGDVSYSNQTTDLNGATIYVNGDVTISGNTTFNGPGTIVASGKIDLSGNTYSSSTVKFISQEEIKLTGNTYTNRALYYSATSLSASGNTRVTVGGFITEGTLSLSGNLNISGIVYSMAGTSMSGNATVRGALVTNSVTGLSGNSKITYDPSVFPGEMPSGFSASNLTVKKGSWRGE